jgi:hypothetical protein
MAYSRAGIVCVCILSLSHTHATPDRQEMPYERARESQNEREREREVLLIIKKRERAHTQCVFLYSQSQCLPLLTIHHLQHTQANRVWAASAELLRPFASPGVVL